MPDEKPQHTEETDQAKEETYIDALTLRLNHSVTDIYIPVVGGELALSVRRNVGGEVWNNTSGLTPSIRPDQPFGVGWSSNLCPNVHLVENIRWEDDPCARLTPTYAYVTDENGQTYKFIVLYNTPEAPLRFIAMPSSTVEQESYTCTLTGSGDGNYVFTKRHGTVIRFAPSGLVQTLLPDRNHPEQQSTYEIHTWSRAVTVRDRFGARLEYAFDPGPNLIPTAIMAYAGLGAPAQMIDITLDGKRVTTVKDPVGNVISYTYDSGTDNAQYIPQSYQILSSVTTALGATNYQYELVSEFDTKPVPPESAPPNPPLTYSHVNLTGITDPNGHTYCFSYQFDWSKLRFDSATETMFTVNGQPRRIIKVDLPDGSRANFEPQGQISFPSEGGVEGFSRTTVTDAEAARIIYNFGGPHVRFMNDWVDYLTSADHDIRRVPLILFQTRTTITYEGGGGVEIFDFNPDAGMALARLEDLNGNVTTYNYNDALPPIFTLGQPVFGFYSDPNAEHRTWTYGGVTESLTKTFTYGVFRIMSASVDELGRQTAYDLDSLGRRTAERISPPGNLTPSQETLFDYSGTFPGFLSQRAVQTKAGDPGWAAALVTNYVPDAYGRIGQEIVNPGSGLNLTTTYVYDLNGNKRTTTDPNGHNKWFTYDAQNRLLQATDEGAGAKTFSYDPRGNKLSEIDESNHTTTFAYDALNRLTTQTRMMSGTANLVTRFAYNRVNSRIQVQDPNGRVTQFSYDILQRLILTIDAASQSTSYAYETADNPGASAFDSSAFKPTRITDPRGVVTRMRYDTLYRLREKSVEYASGLFSTTRLNTDAVGNVVEEIDPLGHSVLKSYDALNRLTLTTFTNEGGVPSTEQRFYTGTGLLRKVIDELGFATDTEYDGAGRAVKAIGPEVVDGTGGLAHPVLQTNYDAVGNVIAKIDPRGFQTDFEYDVRNRKILERRPLVTDAVSGLSQRPEIRWTYDNVGNVTAVRDACGNITNSTYDDANRVILVEGPPVIFGPAGTLVRRPSTQTTYDRNGNVTQVVDPDGYTTVNDYDVLNRLISTTNGQNITVVYGYDAVGNRISVRDGKLQTTRLAYDGLNRLTTTTDPAALTTTLAYDDLNKIRRTDAAEQVTQYTYDVRNRLRVVTYLGRSGDDRTLRYDFLGQLLEVLEPGKGGQADVAYAYDAMRRVVSETSGEQTHSYLYDLAGNRVRVTYGGTGRVVASTYDALNRLLTVVESAAP